MGEWSHNGGFSLDASVRIEAWDHPGLERWLRYCARPPFALKRIEILDDQRIIYHLPKPTPNGRPILPLTPLEFLGRIAALVPEPRMHRPRYYWVLAPHARRRPAVTALAWDAGSTGDDATPKDELAPGSTEEHDTNTRSPARYLWATRRARLDEVLPLICPLCGAPMRIIALVTDAPTVRQILDHLGEPSRPPPMAAARGPPIWDLEDAPIEDPGEAPPIDPEPEYQYDQTLSW